MTCLHAKVQGRWSIDAEDDVETNGLTEAIALPPTLMRSVKMGWLGVSQVTGNVLRLVTDTDIDRHKHTHTRDEHGPPGPARRGPRRAGPWLAAVVFRPALLTMFATISK